MVFLQLLIVLVCIIVGARLGGIGLGVMGGIGVAVLTFVFGLQPGELPIDVMMMIAAVISAAACMQAAGGLDYMVKIAERILRSNPQYVTIIAPLVTYTFTFLAGTGHVAYSVLPVIAEVARETKIRPERPLGIAVIASQQAITASPISAATVALLGLLAGFDITLFDILKISIPATLVGVIVGALFSMRVGKKLVDDPEYQRRLKSGELETAQVELKGADNMFKASISVVLFVCATMLVVLFGSIPSLRPSFDGKETAVADVVYVADAPTEEVNAFMQERYPDAEVVQNKEKLELARAYGGVISSTHGEFVVQYKQETEIPEVKVNMPLIIEMIMLATAALILLITGTSGAKAVKGSVFSAGMQAVVAIFGIAWMGDTFISGNIVELKAAIEGVVKEMPWLFGIALFVMSILLYSQAATVRAIVPLGIALSISPMMLIALFPAVNGYFFIPNYPTLVAAINFDRTGTTRIGKWILNHSFMMPGLVATGVAIGTGLLLIQIF